MSGVIVRSVAAGRVRLTVPWLRAHPGSAGLVDERLTGLRGFRALRVFPRTGSVVIWTAPDLLDVGRLASALEEPPPASAPARPTRSAPDTSTGELARLAVGGAVLALVAVRRLLARPRFRFGSSGAGGVLTVLFTGLPFFRGALRSLRGRGAPGTDTLVSAATLISLVLRENVVALTVLWLLNIGEFLQTLTLRRTRRAIEELLTIGEERVLVVREDGTEAEVALDEVGRGDVVALYEHHRIPVDGHVLSGRPWSTRRPSPARPCRSTHGRAATSTPGRSSPPARSPCGRKRSDGTPRWAASSPVSRRPSPTGRRSRPWRAASPAASCRSRSGSRR